MMTRPARLRYLMRDRMRDGSWRWRVRIRGQVSARLPGDPRTDADAYAAYVQAVADLAGRTSPTPAAPPKGSFAALVTDYLERGGKTASPATMKQRRSLLGRLLVEHGDRVAVMPPRAVRSILFAMEDRPGAAKNTLKALRAMYRWSVERGMIETDPTDGIRWTVRDTGGFRPWTPADLRQFVKHHPPGTTAYLAVALAVFTAARRSDLVRLGRQHIRTVDGIDVLEWRQAKGDGLVSVPILPQLAEAIEAVPADQMVFLHTGHGLPYSANGFGNRMAKWTADAGLAGLTAHGVRKAAGALLAEAGCTAHQIAAILGHSDPQTSSIYTRSADKLTLAREAMAKLRGKKVL